MKTASWTEIKKLIAAQGYKMAALTDMAGQKVVPFNQYKKSAANLDTQLALCQKRLKSDQWPDAYYEVLLAYNIRDTANPYKVIIKKGNPSAEAMEEAATKATHTTIVHKGEGALSYKESIDMVKENAQLAAKLASAEAEIKELKEIVAEYEDEDEKTMSAGPAAPGGGLNAVAELLKESGPTLVSSLQEYFNLQNRKLDLEEKKLNGNGGGGKTKNNVRAQPIETGSERHLKIIEALFTSGNENRLNQELDKLEAVNLELYNRVMKELGLESEEEEENGAD